MCRWRTNRSKNGGICGKTERLSEEISEGTCPRHETIEAKVEWFRSLSLSERMDLLCNITDLALTLNPDILEKKDAQPVKGRIRVLSKT